ncbi:MAG TPA: gluconate:H+ symporter [Cyclobacteriaceae bacterium]|nr:gluconate:H+ symporter [Cyclobacteriaceae bacterium]
MPLFIVFISVLILLGLIIAKCPPLIALLIVSVFAGLAQGMNPADVYHSVEQGIGSTLGSIAMVIALGAMFGKIIEDSGAAYQITTGLIKWFGVKYIQWAVMLTGFIVGIPLFYNAGFVILVPLIFSIASRAGLPLLYVGIPMAASLSVTHGFLPPHPGPLALAAIFHADIGKILLYGLAIGLPTVILAGPVFSTSLRSIKVFASAGFQSEQKAEHELPSMFTSMSIALFPVAIIAMSTLIKSFVDPNSQVLRFFSEPLTALVIAVLLAAYVLSVRRGKSVKATSDVLVQSIGSVAMIILITGAGGAFKQVLIDGGVSTYITEVASGFSLSPLFLAWLIAALLRVAIGSATVASLTAAGIVQSFASQPGVSPELMVLAVGSGSLMFSHVNDTGFWMFKEYFNLTLRQTFLSWSLMETIVSISGLIGVLLFDFLI